MTAAIVAFLAGGLSMWLLGLWLNRNSLIPAGAAALVFEDSGVSVRMPSDDGDASEAELFAFGLFLCVTEDEGEVRGMVRDRVERVAREIRDGAE